MIRSYKEEQELKEKILELRKKNYPYDKIARENLIAWLQIYIRKKLRKS